MRMIDTSYDLVRSLIADAVVGNPRAAVVDGCGYTSIAAIDDALVEAAERVIANAENGFTYDDAAQVIDDGSADGQIGDPTDKSSDLYVTIENMIRLSKTSRDMFWNSEDRQSSISGGEIEPLTSRPQVDAHKKAFLDELLAQCANDAEQEAITAGNIVVLEAA